MNIPHNIEAERALLHQLIFEAIESIHREGRNPDMISVSEWLASSRHNRKARKDSLVEDSLAHHHPLATDRLKYAIDHCHELKRLISKGPQNRKAFFPYQEKLILEYLGEP